MTNEEPGMTNEEPGMTNEEPGLAVKGAYGNKLYVDEELWTVMN
jgi:hypothetical protein